MHISFLKTNCGAEIDGKKKMANWFFPTSILAMSLPQNNLPLFFFPSLTAPQFFFLEMIRQQHFHKHFYNKF